jgi:uncharacterized protein
VSDLTDFREAKDRFFASSDDSPLTRQQRGRFSGLRYYEESHALVFEIAPEVFEERERITMQTSSGTEAVYERLGLIRFHVGDTPCELTIYRDPASGSLFLPFRDASAGRETYGAGRYLEVEPTEDGKLVVDFNYAYNPYCAYNEQWVCPITPPENRLDVPIRAGEMNFEDTPA